jgi:hypothetical protein
MKNAAKNAACGRGGVGIGRKGESAMRAAQGAALFAVDREPCTRGGCGDISQSPERPCSAS